nr:MAG TPA: hypothetical protein [Caudoviricetes sp.]
MIKINEKKVYFFQSIKALILLALYSVGLPLAYSLILYTDFTDFGTSCCSSLQKANKSAYPQRRLFCIYFNILF